MFEKLLGAPCVPPDSELVVCHLPMLRRLSSLLLLLVFCNSAQSQLVEGEPKTRVCDCSTSSQFAWHAENLAMTEAPLLFEGVQEVYVVNPATQEVRAYVVRREMTGSSVGIGDEFWTTEVNPSSGDPMIVDGLHAAIQAVRDFEASIQGTIRLVDHPDPPQPPIGSAFDLVGPDDSAAGFNRGVLNNWMSDLASRNFVEAVDTAIAGELGGSFLQVFSAAVQAILNFVGPNGAVWIEFADGTKVLVVQESTNTSMDPNTGGIDGMEFGYVVDSSTAQSEDLDNAPQSPGQFAGLGSYSGGAVGGLGRLALRLGITLEFGDGGGGTCEGTLECSVDGGVITCKTTLSQEEIANC